MDAWQRCVIETLPIGSRITNASKLNFSKGTDESLYSNELPAETILFLQKFLEIAKMWKENKRNYRKNVLQIFADSIQFQ